ncbi:cobyrinic acid a,c-diamide synthase [Ectothiorhodospira sp. PHS-1]|uniref:cobyrinate a,c-diamide synthase n=1 Tax=Ectothiorhodospira sp. PHS-1 TaxID=519989 RepID=UPI00024A838A|nr:cobyrinate a,c-diamide synthase [Ectothiorhodospira sp. PHS-1]EHQ52181.1 cobyrinic acid a,c-diamide synthase [Ectothiorhodospira sp. PHS-1]
MHTRHCPALLITAPSSGQGKTTVTAALARYHRNQGRRVRVFKGGPDFLDPMIHHQACGHEVHSIDMWMTGEADARQRLFEAAGDADLILVEGVMGLFDGRPSTADIARTLGIPVLASISGAAMAQTFGAIAHGLSTFRPDVPFAGVFANRVSSEGHYRMLLEDLPPGLTALGYLPKAPDAALPSRHLGLVQAEEIQDLDQRLEAAAGRLVWTAGGLPPPVSFAPVDRSPPPRLLAGRRIAVARDAAFAFIYPANLEVLAKLGATLCFFSPVAGERLPEADGVYLPGGYPELHLPALAANERLKQDLLSHISAGRPILAECGGMLYLLERLSDVAGQEADMAGLLPGEARMQGRLAGLGPQEVVLPEGTLRGHTFHHSAMTARIEPLTHACSPNGRATAEPVYRLGPVTASYVHLYFPSNPEAIGHLLGGHRPC